MEQDGPYSVYHSGLQTASDEQTFKNVCDLTKLANKISVLANAVSFLFSYTWGILYMSSENSLCLRKAYTQVPTSMLPEEPPFLGLLDPADIQRTQVSFVNHFLKRRNQELWCDATGFELQ